MALHIPQNTFFEARNLGRTFGYYGCLDQSGLLYVHLSRGVFNCLSNHVPGGEAPSQRNKNLFTSDINSLTQLDQCNFIGLAC